MLGSVSVFLPSSQLTWSPPGYILERPKGTFVHTPGFTHGETEAGGQGPAQNHIVTRGGMWVMWSSRRGVTLFTVFIEQIWMGASCVPDIFWALGTQSLPPGAVGRGDRQVNQQRWC